MAGARGESCPPGGGRALSRGGERGCESVRIPVTPENREVLRSMRARELATWEAATGGAGVQATGRLELPRPDRESQWILLLLAGTGLGLWLQATTAAIRFLEGWEEFRAWIEASVGG